jgi:hypothetical protein
MRVGQAGAQMLRGGDAPRELPADRPPRATNRLAGCGKLLLRLRPHPSRRFAPQDEVNIFNILPHPEEAGPSRRRLAAAPRDEAAVSKGEASRKQHFRTLLER